MHEVAECGMVMSVREAMGFLGVQECTVRRMMQNGKLAAINQGRRVYVTVESVEKEQAARERREERRDSAGFEVGGVGCGGTALCSPGAAARSPVVVALAERAEEEGALMSTAEVAEALGITCEAVNSLARRGRLARVWLPGRRSGFPAEAVRMFALRRELRKKPEPAGLRQWGPRDRPVEHTDVMTTAEAARAIGVSVQRMAQIARQGAIPCYQQKPGVPGSALLFPTYYVNALVRREAYSRHRRAWERGREAPHETCGGWEDLDLRPVPVRGHTEHSARRESAWLTTRQVAVMLGVAPRSVRQLVERGRLHGVRRKRRARRCRPGEWPAGNRWWFFTLADVYALLNDRDYQEHQARHLRGVSAEA